MLSKTSLKDIFQDVHCNKIILIYYRLSQKNKNKILYASLYIREKIHNLEYTYDYLAKIEPALIFVQGTNHNKIIEVLSNPVYQNYTKDYIVIVDKKFVFVGIIYIADIFIAHRLKISIETNKTNLIQSIKHDIDNYSFKDYAVSNNMLIEIHKMVLTDKDGYIIGLINTDHITRHYDIYQNKNQGFLYIFPRKNLFYFLTIVGANFLGTIMSATITMLENLHLVNIILMMFIRCMTDAVLILLIENKMGNRNLNQYVSCLIVTSTIITSILLYIFTNKIKIFIYSFLIMKIILMLSYLILTNMYKKGNNIRIFITLLIPEFVVTFSICMLNRIYKL